MEPPNRILHDLALIYIALAHGTDEHLDAVEMDVIAQRLQDVQPGVSQGTVLRAVKEALDDYTQDDVGNRVELAVDRLRRSVPQSLRRRIVSDLTEIGKADDKFLYAEAQFIGSLVEAWNIGPTDRAAEAATAWNILTTDAHADDPWSPLHDLVLLYVTLAHQTDRSLNRKEVEAILKKVGEWVPNADDETLRRILHDVMRVYQEQDERSFDDAIASVKTALPAYQRQAILEDLRYIADADGLLLIEERVMIEKIARAWDVVADDA